MITKPSANIKTDIPRAAIKMKKFFLVSLDSEWEN